MWKDRVLTAIVPVIWGSTYIVTTEMLPQSYPLTVAMLRALPAGLILLLVVRRLPPTEWLVRLIILGALNFTLFWAALFIAAYRLPGGLAATLGASQPLIVLFLARTMLGTRLQPSALVAALAGIVGVALLILGQQTDLDPIGVAAALTGALSMGAGTVLTRKWQPPVSALTFAAWQLTAGGLLLLPVALFFEPGFPIPSALNLAGLVWLGLIGAALTYFYWFRGIARLGPSAAAAFGFLSPLTAVLLGWAVLGQALSLTQIVGAAIVILSVWLAQRTGRQSRSCRGQSPCTD
ncbi:putative blue pigment (indigoidine) exporter [Rhizobium sp. PP-CC-2G-626]|nr:putative blue pigment (indigoidine) exporter [Rhizobium sp. PP-CC-2G-626]